MNCPAPPRVRPSVSAFTLIELLVVISVIALLIGILLPALGSARDAARTANCLANMRSMGQATVSYTTDFKLTFPQPFTESALTGEQGRDALWYNALDAYLGRSEAESGRNDDSYKQDPVWFRGLPVTLNSGQTLDPEDVRTLKMNQFFGHGPGSTPTGGPSVRFYRQTEIDEPARTVVFGDGRAHDTVSTTSGNIDSGGSGSFSMNPILVAPRHRGGANLNFADGSSSFQINPIRLSGAGYEGWFDPYAGGSSTAPENFPDAIFRFNPEAFGLARIRAGGGGG